MKKNQISEKIERQFETESEKIVDRVEENSLKDKLSRISLSLVMSIIIVGSLLYTLITAYLQSR